MNPENNDRNQQIPNLPQSEGPVKLEDLAHAKNPNPGANANLDKDPVEREGIAEVGSEITDGGAG